MKKHPPVTIALMILSIFAATASAQNEPTVEKVTDRGTLCGYLQDGARIKVMVEPGSELHSATHGINKSFKGTLQSCDDGVLTFWAEGSSGGLVRVPVEHVQTLHFSIGKKGHGLVGAGIGLALGLIAAVVSQADEDDNSWEGVGNELGDEAFDVSAIFGSTLIGAGIGALIRTERWSPVWDEKTLISSVGTRNGQYLVAVGFDF